MRGVMRWVILPVLSWATCEESFASVGDDVVAVFTRAERGEPLRYVAIGGSITQASGDGWAGEWLRRQFPKSDVTVVNSGMSATGSSLGIFRIERDIIAHQPDLVAIDTAADLSDPAIWLDAFSISDSIRLVAWRPRVSIFDQWVLAVPDAFAKARSNCVMRASSSTIKRSLSALTARTFQH